MIRIFVTGGTIDGLGYYDQPSKLRKSLIPSMLSEGKMAKRDYALEVLMQKDSRRLTKKDRELLLQSCLSTKENRIVITHGTYTMAQTARYLGKRNIKKTIVLVGSLVYGNRKDSDAIFNLGGAITAVQLLPNGIYIVMNGRVLSWKNVHHLSSGKFENSGR